MATALQVIGRLAPLLGLLPTTLERQLRAQRLAGQLPTGRPGGGKFSAHFEAQHFANVILGLAGSEPSDAPDAAAALRTMLRTGQPEDVLREALPTFEDQIADWLGDIAEAHRHRRRDWVRFANIFQHWEMSLCLKPRQAVISRRLPGSPEVVIRYASEDATHALSRVTVLHGSLMLAAGELLADSLEQIKANAASQPLSTQPAMAGAEQENAGGLLQEAPGVTRDQPRENGTDRSSNTPDGIRGNREFQAGPVTLTETGSDDRCQTIPMLMT
jgi:hypothetical protein